MARTYFQDFTRDNGLPVTVEYSARGGEPNYDYPGHICDGGGSGPDIVILKAWPNTPWHERIAGIELRLRWPGRRTLLPPSLLAWPFGMLLRLDEWWRANLTGAELERMEVWLAERYVDEDDDYDDWRL